MPRTRVLLLTLLAATVALVGARVTQAADPLKECRLSCKQAKGACIGEVKHHLQALLGECVGGSSERRQCRRQARGTARAERTACGDFVRECHTCCAARGSDCAVRCGDGVVTPARGEQCDPPGSACENGAICDAECHCVTRPGACTGACPIHTVFLILMENHDWSSIKNSPSAPYINNTLLAIASHATQYYNPPGLHPSLPNYLWLEAGTNFGILDDAEPSTNHQSSTAHLVTLLDAAGVSWRAYQEGTGGIVCPLIDQGDYVVHHDPFVYFDDVTQRNNPRAPRCLQHVRPYSELEADLINDTVARYNFVTPNVCDDMHDACDPVNDPVKQGDAWLSRELPKLLGSPSFANNGAIFITWDEAETGDGPIGMIVLSPKAKGGGYQNTIHYTHSTTLRTVEEIFGVTPLLGDAANATDLSDLFVSFP